MRFETATLLGISVLFLFTGFLWPLGFFSMDESIYVQGADVFRKTGGFIFDNGYGRFGSDHLTVSNFLPIGPNGQTTQYPPGPSILGGWAISAFGLRGMMMLNVLATIGSLFVTRALARDLFDDARVAFGATLLFAGACFVADFAFAYWPHMISVFSVNLSFLLFWRAIRGTDRTFLLALASGLVLGAGMLFRLDNILLLPLIGLATILFAQTVSQVAVIAAGGIAGLLPPLLLLASINATRYGTWNPLSYGPSVEGGGGAALSTYYPVMAIGVAAAATLVALRVFASGVRPSLWCALGGVLLAVGYLVSPSVQGALSAYGRGAIDLIVDARLIIDTRPGVEVDDHGIKTFWGLSKKALGQSMPWIGVLLSLIGLAWMDRRRSVTIVLLWCALWTLPFLIQSWHGGAGSNMRYFLPILPPLCALSAWLIVRLAQNMPDAGRLLFVSGVAGAGICVLWMMWSKTALEGVHQVLSTYVFFAVAIASLVAGFIAQRTLRRIALAAIGIGIGVGVFNGLSDARVAHFVRTTTQPAGELDPAYQGEVLIYGYLARNAFNTPGQYVAVTENQQFDMSLVDQALDEGLSLRMRLQLAEDLTEARPDLQIVETSENPHNLVAVTRKDAR